MFYCLTYHLIVIVTPLVHQEEHDFRPEFKFYLYICGGCDDIAPLGFRFLFWDSFLFVLFVDKK